jgi:hypothetical protein
VGGGGGGGGGWGLGTKARTSSQIHLCPGTGSRLTRLTAGNIGEPPDGKRRMIHGDTSNATPYLLENERKKEKVKEKENIARTRMRETSG